ncbi:MAG: tyrosine-type recombinase/integrase [archaeon]|nr:tyrosine-type recombinase/integrase [archaeon]
MSDYSGNSVLVSLAPGTSAGTGINEKDLEQINGFCRDMLAKGISKSRIQKFSYNLKAHSVFLQKMNATLQSASIEHLKELVINIDGNPKDSDWTKRDRKIVIKCFYKWLLGDGEEFPRLVKWIKATPPKNKILPEYILTEEEILKLVEAADHPRDKAFIYTLYESGARVGEVLGLEIKDVVFGDQLTSIQVKGKTGQRRIPLVACTSYLAGWINLHPFKNNPRASLWPARRESHFQSERPIAHRVVIDMLRATAKYAGIKKRVNPHTFRHSRATHLAKKLTEAQLKQFFGWTQSSSMASQYVHLSGRDLDSSIMGIYGIKQPEKDETKITQKYCPRCETQNPGNFNLCMKCGAALTTKTAIELDMNKETNAVHLLQGLLAQVHQLEQQGVDFKQLSKFMEDWSTTKKQET